LTSKPRNAVKALYRSPSECGKRISLTSRRSVPLPTPRLAVVHSPTPSTVRIAASSKGEQKNALAACERWCSLNRILSGPRPSFRWIRWRIHS
jgi:hypothetical protein